MTNTSSQELTLAYAGPFIKLLSISLKNFLSISEIEHTFNQPITLVVGPNGAGKSSIFEAIYYAFNCKGMCRFNKFSEAVKAGEDDTNVCIIFQTKNNHQYELTRHIHHIDDKPENDFIDDASMKCDGKAIYARKSEINGFLEQIGASNAFSRTLPGGFHLINDSPSLNYNLLEQISPYCAELKKSAEKLQFSIPEAQQAYDKADNLLEMYKVQQTENEKTLKALKEQVEALKKNLGDTQDSISEEELNAAQSSMEEMKLKLFKAQSEQSNLKHAVDRLKEISDSIASIDKENSTSSEQLVEKANELTKLSDELDKASEHETEASKKLDVAKSSLSSVSFSLAAAIKKYDTLKSGRCPTCNQTVAASSVEQLMKDVEAVRVKNDFAAKMVEQLQEQEKQFKKNKEEIAQTMQSTSIQLEREKASQKSRAAFLAKLKSEQSESQKIVDSVKITDVSGVQKDYQAAMDDYTEKYSIYSRNENIQNTKNLIEKNERTIQDSEAASSDIRNKIAAQAKVVEEFKKAVDEKNKVVDLINDTVLPYLVKAFSQYIEIAMNEILEKFGYELILDVKDRRAVYQLSKGEYAFQISYISSFEKDLVSITSDVALLKINGYPILLLDEPDRAATPVNSEKVATYLLRMCSENGITQSVIITHNVTTQNVLQDVADVISLEKAVELSI